MNFSTLMNALNRILRIPFQLDGVTLSFETILVYLCFAGLIALILRGIFK